MEVTVAPFSFLGEALKNSGHPAPHFWVARGSSIDVASGVYSDYRQCGYIEEKITKLIDDSKDFGAEANDVRVALSVRDPYDWEMLVTELVVPYILKNKIGM